MYYNDVHFCRITVRTSAVYMTEIEPIKTIAAHSGSPETEPDIEIQAVFIKDCQLEGECIIQSYFVLDALSILPMIIFTFNIHTCSSQNTYHSNDDDDNADNDDTIAL